LPSENVSVNTTYIIDRKMGTPHTGCMATRSMRSLSAAPRPASTWRHTSLHKRPMCSYRSRAIMMSGSSVMVAANAAVSAIAAWRVCSDSTPSSTRTSPSSSFSACQRRCGASGSIPSSREAAASIVGP